MEMEVVEGNKGPEVEGKKSTSEELEPVEGERKSKEEDAVANFDYMYKILLVGNSGVGKTKLLTRFCENTFSTNFVSTVGIDFKVKSTTSMVNGEDKRIKLQLWDTGGQERYRSIATAYYFGAVGFLIVFDVTYEDSFLAVKSWYEGIKEMSPQTLQIVLVGNKCELTESRVITKEQGMDLAQSLGVEYFETSARDDVNVKQTFETLVDLISEKMAESIEKIPNFVPRPRRISPEATDSGDDTGEAPAEGTGGTLLTKEVFDALMKLLKDNGVDPYPDVHFNEVRRVTLEEIEQDLKEKGYKEIATDLQAKLTEILQSQVAGLGGRHPYLKFKKKVRAVILMIRAVETLKRGFRPHLIDLLVIGSSGVGKGAVMGRYCDNCFPPQPHDLPAANKLLFRHGSLRRIKLSISKMHEVLGELTCHGVIIMFDLSESSSIEKAIILFTSVRKGNFPVVLVGNKCDLTESRVITKEEGKDLAQRFGMEYFETSAKDDVNVSEVFERLIDLITEPNIDVPDTALTQEDNDALRKVLGDKADFFFGDSSNLALAEVQQMLRKMGLVDLATNLRAKLNEVIGEQKQYLQRLESLMTDEDSISLCYLKVFLVGPPFVGKTTTLNRLLKEYENLRTAGEKGKLRSTLLANCTQVLAFVGEGAADWLCSKDVHEEAILLFRYLSGDKPKIELSQKKKELPKPPQSTPDTPKKPEVLSESQPISQPTESSFTEVTPDEPNPKVPPVEKNEAFTHQKKFEEIKSRLQKLIKNGDYSAVVGHMGNTLLNINDIGGQPGFLEMLPALSIGPAMYLLFLDASKDLNLPYKIPFSRDETIITPFDAIHTVKATLSQILSSIASVHYISREPAPFNMERAVDFSEKFEKFQKVRPIAALIGTHLDKVENPEKSTRQINEDLHTVVEEFSSIMVTPGREMATFFPVDNYAGTEKSDIGPIRSFMNKMFSTHFKEASLPIRKKWLLFGIILRREYRIVSMDECMEIGMLLDMDKGEIRFCLWYLHQCIGTLMYYPGIPGDDGDWFKSHVICSPQVIFDSISQLILASLRTLHSSGVLLESDRRDWIEKGQFSLESIEKYCAIVDESEIIPAKKLVQLLEHVNLLSPITHDGQTTYLMPAVLECASMDELTNPPPPDDNIPEPICISFDCGFVPTGVFCGLITRLVSHGPNGILGLTWELEEQNVKRNHISFLVDDVHKVTLICHEKCYEIRVTRGEPEVTLHDLCAYTLSVILYALKCLFQDLAPQISFRCPCSKHSSRVDITNLCTLSHGSRIRFLCGGKSVSLRPEQQVWLGKYVPLGGSAELEVLKNVGDGFSFSWSKIGSKRLLRTTDEPSVLTFANVKQSDLGYYECELKEAGGVVLTVLRALYKFDSAATPPVKTFVKVASGPKNDHTRYLGDLRRALWDVRARWEDLTLELGFPTGTRDAISLDHEGVARRFTALLEEWLREDPQLHKLLEALRSPIIERDDLADNLEEKLRDGTLKLWD